MEDKVIEKINAFFDKASKETGQIQEKLQVSIKLVNNELELNLLNEYIPVRNVDLWNDILGVKRMFDFLGYGEGCQVVIGKNFDKYSKKFEYDKNKISFVIFKSDGRYLVLVYCGNKAQMLSSGYNSLPIQEFISLVSINI